MALLEEMSTVFDGPAEAMLGNIDDTGTPVHKMWADPVSENPNPTGNTTACVGVCRQPFQKFFAAQCRRLHRVCGPMPEQPLDSFSSEN